MKITTVSAVMTVLLCIALLGLTLGVLLEKTSKPSQVPYILEYMRGDIGQEIAFLSSEGHYGNMVKLMIALDPGKPDHKEQVLWSSIVFSKSDCANFVYLEGLINSLNRNTVLKSFCKDEEKPEDYKYLYIYRVFNDTTQTILVKLSGLYAFTGTVMDIGPKEIANLYIMTDSPPKTIRSTLKFLKEIKIGNLSLYPKTLSVSVISEMKIPDIESE